LEALETSLAVADDKDRKPKRQKDAESNPAPDSTLLAEWKSSELVRDWARLSPKLSGLDLRPYLFVTKDKKDYFGPVSVLGHLAGVVEKLFGGRMTVQGYDTELKQLVVPEAEKVFEAVRSKIMGTGAFDTKPAGVDGLAVLVKAQPSLQSRLMDFLEALPSSKCGPWAVSGWQGVIKDTECAGRLTKLLGSWSKVTNNAGLKTGAEAALKDLKGEH
ncbi:MAG: NTPase KAP, partial [Xanthomonadales bacterium]|nr:NTPase KAP [Xanthomonadales bacterium]